MVRYQDKNKNVDKPDGLCGDYKYKAGVMYAVGEFLSSRSRHAKRHRSKKQEQERLW